MKKAQPSHLRRRTTSRRISRVLFVNAVAVFVAVSALGYVLYIESPVTIAQSASRLMASASISVTAAVPENPYNTLAGQLADEKNRLDTRQAALNARESALNKSKIFGVDWGFVSVCISGFLLILVGLNFYFDMRRRGIRPTAPSRKFLIDLS